MIQRPTYRDIPQLGISIPAPAMHRFWTMLAHCHGQTQAGLTAVPPENPKCVLA